MIDIKDIDFRYSHLATKFLRKHDTIRAKFEHLIWRLINHINPEQINVKRLHGNMEKYSRIAIGGYRVIYEIKNGEIIIVDVVLAGSRGDVYKKFRR